MFKTAIFRTLLVRPLLGIGLVGVVAAGVVALPTAALADDEIDAMPITRSGSRGRSIAATQRAALRYFGLEDDTIEGLKSRTRWKHLLPNISINTSYSDSDTNQDTTDLLNSLDPNAPTQVLVIAGRTISIGGNASWSLPSLIFNGDELSARGLHKDKKSMLEEITKTYYARKRLEAEIQNKPAKDEAGRVEKQLKLEELTAKLDYLTGGWFSGRRSKR